MTDPRNVHSCTDTAVRDYVQALLRQQRADEDARQETIRNLEKTGRRIVGGGQTTQDEWEITDWRTGEILASGAGGLDGYDEAAKRLDANGTWLHIDTVDGELTSVSAAGVPASLAEALQDWLGMSSTPDEDVAEFVGWSVDDVARHRAEA
jgi:hypothetical protein